MKSRSGPFNLASTYMRLRPDVSVEPLPVDDAFWRRLSRGELGTFHNEYLVTCHSVDCDWPIWEMHPNGDEVVCLLARAATMVFEEEGQHRAVELKDDGAYVIVPKGIWHTTKVSGPSRMLFITAGEGTQHREVTR